VGDPEGDGLVVALAELGQQFRVSPGLTSGPGPGGRLMGLAEDLDHIAGPGVQAAGAQLGDRPAPADHVRGALLATGQLRQQLLAGGIPAGDEEPGEEIPGWR
jgi:hypothetical protein